MSKRILALTDLSSRSDRAVQHAGALAISLDAELQLLHPLGLKRRTLRDAVPLLHDLTSTLQDIDRALRDQVERLVPSHVRTASPEIDFEAAPVAVHNIVRSVRPCAVVLDISVYPGVDADQLVALSLSVGTTPVVLRADDAAACNVSAPRETVREQATHVLEV